MSEEKLVYYSIAGLYLSVEKDLMMIKGGDGQYRCRLNSFSPFQRTAPIGGEPTIRVVKAKESEQQSAMAWSAGGNVRLLHSFEFSDVDAICRFYKVQDKDSHTYLLDIEKDDKIIAEFRCEALSDLVTCRSITGCSIDIDSVDFTPYLRFGLWFSLGISAARRMVAAIHSSTIVYEGKAVMFLGESGTGKSTHTRLWREAIEGARLLNDDSPFIGFADQRPIVYGSPWSGKTNCYKDEEYPLHAIVRLSQAPHNRIYSLKGVAAIGALLPSLPPAFAFDESLKEMMFDILSRVLAVTKVYHLECLPNTEAAQVAHKAIFGE